MTNQDAEQLRLLSIFHYVVAGISFLFSFFPIFYCVIGIAMLSGAFQKGAQQPPPEAMGWLFIAIGAVFTLMGFGFTVCVVLAGRFLSARRRYYFCMVTAAISCMFMPFGTVLGVFTIIVLSRTSVHEEFMSTSQAAGAT